MSKAGYLPTAEKDRLVWFNNFSDKFSKVATNLGFVATDVASVTNDAAMFSYLITCVEMYTTAKEQCVDYKNLISKGPIGATGSPVPPPLAMGMVPTEVAPGIFPRISRLVERIKASPAYTEAIGKDLGIIGAQQTVDTDSMKPALKLVFKGGQVEIQWVKGNADAIRIESDKGTGWHFLAVDSVPHYTDTTAITTAATWKYRAMYIISDELVGQWSDVASMAVS
jgi:hypothetical protein